MTPPTFYFSLSSSLASMPRAPPLQPPYLMSTTIAGASSEPLETVAATAPSAPPRWAASPSSLMLIGPIPWFTGAAGPPTHRQRPPEYLHHLGRHRRVASIAPHCRPTTTPTVLAPPPLPHLVLSWAWADRATAVTLRAVTAPRAHLVHVPLRITGHIPIWAGPAGRNRGPQSGLALCAWVFQFYLLFQKFV
jgi:hypothetical protein